MVLILGQASEGMNVELVCNLSSNKISQRAAQKAKYERLWREKKSSLQIDGGAGGIALNPLLNS